MVAKILNDPEASQNDKFVALTMLRNAEIAAKGQVPFCQDAGTAIIMGKKAADLALEDPYPVCDICKSDRYYPRYYIRKYG